MFELLSKKTGHIVKFMLEITKEHRKDWEMAWKTIFSHRALKLENTVAPPKFATTFMLCPTCMSGLELPVSLVIWDYAVREVYRRFRDHRHISF